MSTFGHYFRVTTYGESHCRSVGCIVDGCPPGLELTERDIQPQLTRRRPGQSALTTPIHSGTEFGITLGTPIQLQVRNEDQRPKDYSGGSMDEYPRPSHADYTYKEKYGVKASSGGGRSSARETIARVAAGAIAEKYLRLTHGIEIVAFVSSVGPIHLHQPAAPSDASDAAAAAATAASSNPEHLALLARITRAEVDAHAPVRCPDAAAAARMAALIARYRDAKDSIGGSVTCVIRGLPAGLGEPAFDKLEALLAHAMLSIPATKGFEIGSGFAGCEMPGSLHNDPFVVVPDENDGDGDGSGVPATNGDEQEGANGAEPGAADAADAADAAKAPVSLRATVAADAPAAKSASTSTPPRLRRVRLTTKTNNSGGIQGGISNGAPVFFRVAFKPPATIGQAQRTAAYASGAEGVLAAKGRHDPCVVPRAVPIVEAMAALVVMDALLAQHARQAARAALPPLPPATGAHVLPAEATVLNRRS